MKWNEIKMKDLTLCKPARQNSETDRNRLSFDENEFHFDTDINFYL